MTQEYLARELKVMNLGRAGSTAIVHAPYVKRVRAIDIRPHLSFQGNLNEAGSLVLVGESFFNQGVPAIDSA